MAMKNSNKKLNYCKYCYKRINSAKEGEVAPMGDAKLTINNSYATADLLWMTLSGELRCSICVEGLDPRRRLFDACVACSE